MTRLRELPAAAGSRFYRVELIRSAGGPCHLVDVGLFAVNPRGAQVGPEVTAGDALLAPGRPAVITFRLVRGGMYDEADCQARRTTAIVVSTGGRRMSWQPLEARVCDADVGQLRILDFSASA